MHHIFHRLVLYGVDGIGHNISKVAGCKHAQRARGFEHGHITACFSVNIHISLAVYIGTLGGTCTFDYLHIASLHSQVHRHPRHVAYVNFTVDGQRIFVTAANGETIQPYNVFFYGYRGVAYGKGRAQHIDIDGGFVKLQIAIQLRMVAVTADIHAPVESA